MEKQKFMIAARCEHCKKIVTQVISDDKEIGWGKAKVEEILCKHRMVHQAIMEDKTLAEFYKI